MRLAPDRLETPRLPLERCHRYGLGFWLVSERATGEPVGQVGLPIQGVEGARRVLFCDLEHIVYRVEAARCP